MQAGYQRGLARGLAPVAADGLGPVTVLRDYHADNLMVISGRAGIAISACSISRTRWRAIRPTISPRCSRTRAATSAPSVERAMIDRYVERRRAKALNSNALIGRSAAQRNTQILGIFTRLWKRDGKPHYNAFQPRMWGLLERDLAHPALAPVRAWFDANVPAEKRAAAWPGEAA